MSATTTRDQQLEIDTERCLALTGDAEQCRNKTDTDASDPDRGLCGVHNGRDPVRVSDFDEPAWIGLRDDFLEMFRDPADAYALATLSPDAQDVWQTLTGLQDITIGPLEYGARRCCALARDLATHPDVDVEDHPLGVGGCIALQGKSAKNHSCPNTGYGTALLCGMHKDADLRGTVLDEGEPGPDLEGVTIDGADYQLVERRGTDLIVVNPREWTLERLEDAASTTHREDDEKPGVAPVEPEAPDSIPKYLREGVGKQGPAALRDLAEYALAMADYQEAQAERKLEANAERRTDETPEEWDADDWEDAVDDAREDANLPDGKGTLTVKTIDENDYYYLQWRDGEKIKSQYVAPVTPSR